MQVYTWHDHCLLNPNDPDDLTNLVLNPNDPNDHDDPDDLTHIHHQHQVDSPTHTHHPHPHPPPNPHPHPNPHPNHTHTNLALDPDDPGEQSHYDEAFKFIVVFPDREILHVKKSFLSTLTLVTIPPPI